MATGFTGLFSDGVFWLSLAAEAFLLARANPWSVLLSLVLLFSFSCFLCGRKGQREEKAYRLKGWETALLVVLQAVVTGYAAINWGEAYTGINEGLPLLKYFFSKALWMPAVLLVAGAFGFLSLRRILAALLRQRDQEARPISNNRGLKPWQRWGWCFLCALVPLAFCSENSFLYPLNDWVDVNCFMTVGKSWMHGMIPYRDLIEQKGPYLYLLYGIGSLLSSGSYIGAWVLEVLSGTVFLYYIGRILALYTGEDAKKELLLVPLFAVLTFTSEAFYLGGSTEEFCLPMIACTTYLGLRLLKEQRVPTFKESLVQGIFVGLILWSKFTVLGFYIGWVLFIGIFLLKKESFRECIRLLLGLLAGLLLVTAPVLVYFGVHRALGDLFEIYFYDNIFLYPHLGEGGSPILSLLSHYVRGIILLVTKNPVTTFLLILFSIIRRNRETGLLWICSAVLFLTSFIGKWSWGFYTLAFIPVAAAGMGNLFAYRPEGSIRIPAAGRKAIQYAAVAALLLFSVLLTPNKGFLLTPKEETDQYRFAQIMHEKENPTLLHYGSLDDGYYQAAGILPTCRAFCGLASPIPEVYQLQRESIEQGLTDFVVSVYLKSEKYEEVASGKKFRLYRLGESGTD